MFTLDEIKYGGKYHPFFWEDMNPYASIPNGLGNCTNMTYGDCLIDGWVPITKAPNANNWHLYANGEVIPFDISLVQVGDVIEWVKGCHVARVDEIIDGMPYLNCSWYTGIHGVAVYNKEWDKRPFVSMQQLSDFMVNNYPTRMYHHWSLEKENEGVGGEPAYIIRRAKVIEADGENKNLNQIEVLTNEQNVRTEPSASNPDTIVGVAQSGFYNVYGTIYDGKYNWYQIRENLYIAGVEGRVVYIEASDDISRLRKEIEMLTKRNQELMNAIESARKDLEV